MLLNLHVVAAINGNADPIVDSLKGLSIKGQVKELGNNIPCWVRLFEKNTGRFIAEKATDQNGFYEFDHLSPSKFFIVAHHPLAIFNAVIQDNVIPK